MKNSNYRTFYEFFAGAGMARAGFGNNWYCLYANDFDKKKANTYTKNWTSGDLFSGKITCKDIKDIEASELPDYADLAWASFPCQDLSLAGAGAGLEGERSGTFWSFWHLMSELREQHRSPKIVVLENVCGALSSNKGKDFQNICNTFIKNKYKFGAIVVDAAMFLPQSRPRLFVIGIREDIKIPDALRSDFPDSIFHSGAIKKAYGSLSLMLKKSWVWWDLKEPAKRKTTFLDLIEDSPVGVDWHSETETKKLLRMMSEVNIKKVKHVRESGVRTVGTIYKRTRLDKSGCKVQRAEVRFDGIAGCLRTPAGGSSRQLIIVIDNGKIMSRLISPRETARLMGLADSYKLPENYNECYHLTGDGVAVPVVNHITKNLLEPILSQSNRDIEVA